MTEDDVLECTINYLVPQGYALLYRTQAVGTSAQGGVDALLAEGDLTASPPQFTRYAFVEAKGDEGGDSKRSSEFNNCLGAILKRIRLSGGYFNSTSQNEAAAGFVDPARFDEIKEAVRANSNLPNCRYIVALTPGYDNRVRTTLDQAVLAMLHVEVLVVDGAGTVQPFNW